jgi:hypothetical protein
MRAGLAVFFKIIKTQLQPAALISKISLTPKSDRD